MENFSSIKNAYCAVSYTQVNSVLSTEQLLPTYKNKCKINKQNKQFSCVL